MIVPKRRVVFFFVVISSSIWIYIATYLIFSGELLTDSFTYYDEGTLYNILMYDVTPNRNPQKPGEWGVAVSLNFLEKKREEQGFKDHAFNRVASDKISVERSLPDMRNSK